jgi:hypothetical protein
VARVGCTEYLNESVFLWPPGPPRRGARTLTNATTTPTLEQPEGFPNCSAALIGIEVRHAETRARDFRPKSPESNQAISAREGDTQQNNDLHS